VCPEISEIAGRPRKPEWLASFITLQTAEWKRVSWRDSIARSTDEANRCAACWQRLSKSDGSLDGNKLVFTTVARLNGEDLVLEWRGEATGDDLTLRREFPSKRPLRRPYPPFNGPFVLHRAK
jgi:hypothetical protein